MYQKEKKWIKHEYPSLEIGSRVCNTSWKKDLPTRAIISQPIAIIASQAINQKRRAPRIVRV